MERRRYFDNVSVSGFGDSSDSEEVFVSSPVRERRGTFGGGPGGSRAISPGVKADPVKRRLELHSLTVPETINGVPVFQLPPLPIYAPPQGRPSSVDADGVTTDIVDNQPSPVLLIDEDVVGVADGAKHDDDGYETMNVDVGKDGDEADDGGWVPSNQRDASRGDEIAVVEDDDEETAGVKGSGGVSIYCVCCSQKVDTPRDLKNKLCKRCIEIVVEDPESCIISTTVRIPCAICSKRFSKPKKERNQLCAECTSIILYGYEHELGVTKVIVVCIVCRRPFTRASDKTEDAACPQCVYVMKNPKAVKTPDLLAAMKQDSVRWPGNDLLQGYTGLIVTIQLRRYFYKWCEGHRNGVEAQEGHRCTEKSYAFDALRKVCYMMCPSAVVKMINSLQLDDGLKLRVDEEEMVVNNALWSIYLSDDPYARMNEFERTCPTRAKSRIERAVNIWGARLCPIRYWEPLTSLKRRLSFDDSP